MESPAGARRRGVLVAQRAGVAEVLLGRGAQRIEPRARQQPAQHGRAVGVELLGVGRGQPRVRRGWAARRGAASACAAARAERTNASLSSLSLGVHKINGHSEHSTQAYTTLPPRGAKWYEIPAISRYKH